MAVQGTFACMLGLALGLAGCTAQVAGFGAGAPLQDKGPRVGSSVRLLPGGTVPPEGTPPGDIPNEMTTPPPSGGCAGLDYLGECQGNVARWCDDRGALQQKDCGATGETCGFINEAIGNYCRGTSGGTPPAGPGTTGPTGPTTPTTGCGDPIETEQLELTNQAAQQGGNPAMVCDDKLTITARKHSQDMCDNGYFDHTGRDGSQPWDRAMREGTTASAENIAWGQQTPADVHQSWMNSPGHYANIMGGHRRIGIGYVECGGSPLWTQIFGD